MSDLNCKENDNNTAENREFMVKMLQKCEVSSYTDLYTKLVANKGDLVRCEEIFSDNPAYTFEKIICDVHPIPGLLCLDLFDPRITAQKNTQEQMFKKIPYLVNETGLVRVIQRYRTDNYLPKTIKWERLLKLWGIQKEEEQKLLAILQHLIETKAIRAEIAEKPELTLNFLAIMEIPEKKNKVFQLVGVILIFASLLVALILLMKDYDVRL